MHSVNRTPTHKSVVALAEDLRSSGLHALASDVTFGPIAVAANTVHSKHCDDEDLEVEDVLDDASDSLDDEQDIEDSTTDFDDILDNDADESPESSIANLVVLDMHSTYSKRELNTLRAIASSCIAKKKSTASATALLRSLDAYEQQH